MLSLCGLAWTPGPDLRQKDAIIHKRFNMSQAGFIERWCLNNVLAEVSSGADGSAVVRVHVPPLNAVTVPVAT